jgi:RNA-directed DNA polymerase
LVKYADDLVILCATRGQAQQARELAAAILDGLGLRLHPDKTRIADLSRGAEGFAFLGFEHRMRESWKQMVNSRGARAVTSLACGTAPSHS